MSTRQRSFPTAADTERKARYGSFDVDFVGAGEWTVESRASGEEYTVMLREGRFECSCESFNYHCIHGPRERCKHAECVKQIVDGDLCDHCTMPRCRPSCPRSDSR